MVINPNPKQSRSAEYKATSSKIGLENFYPVIFASEEFDSCKFFEPP